MILYASKKKERHRPATRGSVAPYGSTAVEAHRPAEVLLPLGWQERRKHAPAQVQSRGFPAGRGLVEPRSGKLDKVYEI